MYGAGMRKKGGGGKNFEEQPYSNMFLYECQGMLVLMCHCIWCWSGSMRPSREIFVQPLVLFATCWLAIYQIGQQQISHTRKLPLWWNNTWIVTQSGQLTLGAPVSGVLHLIGASGKQGSPPLATIGYCWRIMTLTSLECLTRCAVSQEGIRGWSTTTTLQSPCLFRTDRFGWRISLLSGDLPSILRHGAGLWRIRRSGVWGGRGLELEGGVTFLGTFVGVLWGPLNNVSIICQIGRFQAGQAAVKQHLP